MIDLDLDCWRGTLNPQQHKDGNTTFICHTNERFTSLPGDIFLISYHSSLPAYLFNYTTCAIADIKFFLLLRNSSIACPLTLSDSQIRSPYMKRSAFNISLVGTIIKRMLKSSSLRKLQLIWYTICTAEAHTID